MKDVSSVKIIDKNGKEKTINEPIFGSLKISTEGGRTVITKRYIFGETKTIPSNDSTIEVKK